MRKCLKCGADNPEGRRWCQKCLKPLVETENSDLQRSADHNGDGSRVEKKLKGSMGKVQTDLRDEIHRREAKTTRCSENNTRGQSKRIINMGESPTEQGDENHKGESKKELNSANGALGQTKIKGSMGGKRTELRNEANNREETRKLNASNSSAGQSRLIGSMGKFQKEPRNETGEHVEKRGSSGDSRNRKDSELMGSMKKPQTEPRNEDRNQTAKKETNSRSSLAGEPKETGGIGITRTDPHNGDNKRGSAVTGSGINQGGIRCSGCGKMNTGDSVYCVHCGKNLRIAAKPKGRNGKKFLAPIAAACALVVVCGGIAAFFFGGGNGQRQEDLESLPKTEIIVQSAEEVIAELKETASEYGYTNALSELTEKSSTAVDGDSYYRLQQNYQGIPVYGRTVVCATDEKGNVTSITDNVVDVAENIDLVPTVTASEVEVSVNTYFADEFGFETAASIDKLSKEDLCIYNMSDTMEPRLAYCITQNCYVFIVDAINGEILHAYSTIDDVTVDGYKASDVNMEDPFEVERYSDVEYVLENKEYNVAVKNLDGNISKDNKGVHHWDRASRVVSVDNIFGNTETETEYEEGVIFLQIFLKLYDYFAFDVGVEKQSNSGGFVIYYNDGYKKGRNALGGNDENQNGILSLGTVTGVTDIDVFAHEYTHIITKANVGWLKNTTENKAIEEAFSDIFGELAEASYFAWSAPDWIISGDNIDVSRNLADPSKSGTAENTNDSYAIYSALPGKTVAKQYYYSTVISHAAYLMWNGIDGTESKRIGTDDLTKLWYRAMLMMPPDCDFVTCRNVVELAARSMSFTTAQIACVSEAFDEVGITKDTEPAIATKYEVSPNCKLHVTRGDGHYYANYTLVISKKKKSESEHVRTVSVGTEGGYALGLEEGNYIFEIRDNADLTVRETFTVKVDKDASQKDLIIKMNFSHIPVNGTVSEVRMENGVEVNVPVSNAVVTVYSHAENATVETINMAETEGIFVVYLPTGNYSFTAEAEGYISSTVSFEVTSETPEYLTIILKPDVDLVTDAYVGDYTHITKMYNYETGKSEDTEVTYTFRIPQINISSDDAVRINREVYDSLYSVIERAVSDLKEYGCPGISDEVSYSWAINGDILSLIIRNYEHPTMSGGYEYTVYNLSVKTGKLVSDEDVIAAAGFSRDEYNQRAKEVLGSRLWGSLDPSSERFEYQMEAEWFNDRLRKTLSEENIARCKPYLNDKNQLCMIALVYSMAAGDAYWNDLNMVDFELSPYYATEVGVATHVINITEEEAYQIACDYWNYSEGDVSPETGFEMYVVLQPGDSPIKDSKTGKHYYCFLLRWLVIGENGDSWMSTCDMVHVDAETGECTFFS